MKTIGIATHSAEGGALCFVTACREGAKHLGEHMHPNIAASAIPMGLSMAAWRSDDHETVAHHLLDGIDMVDKAGADFFVCPDNTAHIVLEKVADRFPIPGLHIADVVCHEIVSNNWTRVALLGTDWTMTGPIYASRIQAAGWELLIPDGETRRFIDDAIFKELCNGEFKDGTIVRFIEAIASLEARGAECVILGCTEIPLIVTPENSPLPTLDSTSLLASYAVAEALADDPLVTDGGWLHPR